MTQPFADLEIRIFPRRDQGYPVYIRLDGQDFPPGHLAPDILSWTPDNVPEKDGQSLFGLLLADPILRSAWDQARNRSPRCRLRLWVEAEEPKLHALPWELLRQGDVLLAADETTPFFPLPVRLKALGRSRGRAAYPGAGGRLQPRRPGG